jgi:hypothetical protein
LFLTALKHPPLNHLSSQKNWAEITHCSSTCRAHRVKPGSLDAKFETEILRLLHERHATFVSGKQKTAPIVTCEEVEDVVLTSKADATLRTATSSAEEREDTTGGVFDAAEAVTRTDEGSTSSAEEVVQGTEEDAGLKIESNREHGEMERRDLNVKRTRERCRQAARRLAAKGQIQITQDGKVVEPSFAKGVMELRLP